MKDHPTSVGGSVQTLIQPHSSLKRIHSRVRAYAGQSAAEIDSPLGMTCDDFVRTHADHFHGRSVAALDAYRTFFQGDANQTQLKADLPFIGTIEREQSVEGEVAKFILKVPSAPTKNTEPIPILETESVLIPMLGRSKVGTHTLCVSSQVGCAMGCTFCETAQMGLIRNLSAAEIVAQWWAAAHIVGIRPSNIVFMGMGEPMDNFDAVLLAIEVLTDHRGANIPMSRVAVSTVGRIDGIKKLGERVRNNGWHKLSLAVSLNASNDAVRSEIMPLNRSVPMGTLRQTLLDYPQGRNKICFEYVLIPGVNNEDAHALELVEYLQPFLGKKPRAMVNVIPYNPRRNSPWPAPTEADADRFVSLLNSKGIYVKLRRTKGRTMMGACGQLGNENIRKRKAVPGTAAVSISAGK